MHRIGLGVFYLSGFAALLYQVVWQRMLAMFSGSDVYSSTIIVAAFMAGLGAGNLAGGHLADRFSPRANLRMFAVAEMAIAVYVLLSRWLLYDVLYQQIAPMAPTPLATASILFVTLLWPTFFMGVSLPLLARALTVHIDRAASTIGALYGVNTLGAATGALVATWWALPRFGMEGSLWIGAVLNVACAVLVLPFAHRVEAPTPAAVPSADESASPSVRASAPERRTLMVWGSVYALSGMLALSLEILWFRLLGVMVKSTAFTFGTLLACFLAGLAAGALVGGRYAARVRRPATAFLGLQAGVGLSAVLLIWAVVDAAGQTTWLREYFGAYEPFDVRQGVVDLRAAVAGVFLAAPNENGWPWQFVALYAVLPAVLILPPTFLMGLSFPVLQRVVQNDLARLGRRVGLLLVANIAGSVAGTVLTGWVMLDRFGTAGTLRLLTALSGLFLVAAAVASQRSQTGRVAGAAAWRVAGAVAVAIAIPGLAIAGTPDGETLWARLHGTTGRRIIFDEDATGLSVLRVQTRRGSTPATVVFVNGVGQSTTPFGGVHTALGVLPAFIHPNPKDAAIIGLGSGDTLYAMAGRPTLERITSIEIIEPQMRTLQEFAGRHGYAGLVGLLADPRITHVSGDGRLHLRHTPRTFDIIEADALRPTSAYSGNLYSDAYFELLRARLKPNGLAATWVPTRRVRNTFLKVFPHAIALHDMLIGSNEPIDFDPEVVRERLADPQVTAYYERAEINLHRALRSYLRNPRVHEPDSGLRQLSDVNTDLFPRDEYDLQLR